jgi:hypothetical protein
MHLETWDPANRMEFALMESCIFFRYVARKTQSMEVLQHCLAVLLMTTLRKLVKLREGSVQVARESCCLRIVSAKVSGEGLWMLPFVDNGICLSLAELSISKTFLHPHKSLVQSRAASCKCKPTQSEGGDVKHKTIGKIEARYFKQKTNIRSIESKLVSLSELLSLSHVLHTYIHKSTCMHE